MSVHFIFLAASFVLQIGAILRAIMVEGRDPYARLAWVMTLLMLPLLGVVAYAMFGEPWVSRRFRRKANKTFRQLERLSIVNRAEVSVERLPQYFVGALRVCEALAKTTATDHNTVQLIRDSNTTIDLLVADISAAQESVHISFYIWLIDTNGLKVVEAVCVAARRGITCRITADAIGSRTLIHSAHWQRMLDAGAKLCASLSAPKGLASIEAHRLDLRNHRKIVVIDNFITYCGSQNCADPEFLIKAHFAPWVDIMLRLTGAVAIQNQLIFAAAWTVETGEDLSAWLDRAEPPQADGNVLAIAFGTGPLSVKGAMSDAFSSVLYAAEQEVVISTPYFVPDPPLLAALASCARRGVATSLILPACNDSRIVGAISRALYPQLIAAGIRVFEYRGGLLHAKTLVADGTVCLIGSANMDRRSLELNFENNIFMYSFDVCEQIRQRQNEYYESSVEITRSDVESRSFLRRLNENLLTMASAIF